MLKGISNIVSPELLKILCEMGHGDEIVIGDGNFPARSMSKNLVRCDGNTVTEILSAILPLFPLEHEDKYSAILMDVRECDKGKVNITRWDEYQKEIGEESRFNGFLKLERYAFYERAKKAYAVVSSGDFELYANIILVKGVVK